MIKTAKKTNRDLSVEERPLQAAFSRHKKARAVFVVFLALTVIFSATAITFSVGRVENQIVPYLMPGKIDNESTTQHVVYYCEANENFDTSTDKINDIDSIFNYYYYIGNDTSERKVVLTEDNYDTRSDWFFTQLSFLARARIEYSIIKYIIAAAAILFALTFVLSFGYIADQSAGGKTTDKIKDFFKNKLQIKQKAKKGNGKSVKKL